jgi:hypothetical protein
MCLPVFINDIIQLVFKESAKITKSVILKKPFPRYHNIQYTLYSKKGLAIFPSPDGNNLTIPGQGEFIYAILAGD